MIRLRYLLLSALVLAFATEGHPLVAQALSLPSDSPRWELSEPVVMEHFQIAWPKA